MAKRLLEIGKVYHREEPVVLLELNLEDLYFVQALVPNVDGFRKDLQDGIDAIEKHEELMRTEEGYGLAIVIQR